MVVPVRLHHSKAIITFGDTPGVGSKSGVFTQPLASRTDARKIPTKQRLSMKCWLEVHVSVGDDFRDRSMAGPPCQRMICGEAFWQNDQHFLHHTKF